MVYPPESATATRRSPDAEHARASEKVQAHLNGEEQRVIVVPDKLVNIVV